MDIVSHGLWGAIAFGRSNKKSFWKSFLWGIAPDLFSFGVFFIGVYLGIHERPQFKFEPPDPNIFPSYLYTLYGFTHSIIVFALVFFLVWLLFKKPVWEMLAWGLHIIVDIFTHSFQFFPTPFLWPISDFQVNGIPWGDPIIFFPNITLLIVLYLWFYLVKPHLREKRNF